MIAKLERVGPSAAIVESDDLWSLAGSAVEGLWTGDLFDLFDLVKGGVFLEATDPPEL